MNSRIAELRRESVEAAPRLDMERARLLTEFYDDNGSAGNSIPVMRALAFRYILQNKEIYVGEKELIVGERGPEPKAAPSYPEICTHSSEDLRVLREREKIAFGISEEDERYHIDNILPFWAERSIRSRIFSQMDESWIDAYDAGIFTEFMEQRAPGHTVMDGKIYLKGFGDFRNDIKKSIERLDFFQDERAWEKREELRAMDIAAGALISYAERYSGKLKAMASAEEDRARREELMDISRICSRVPGSAPETFHEALQYYWFVHLGVITELNTWDSFNPGRLDRHLFPLYTRDIETGRMTRDRARELLQAFWIKFNNQPAPPKVGVTARESNTYTDFCLINLGGVNRDGEDAVNELTFMILDVIEEMRLLQPSSMIQVSRKNPDSYIKRALKIIKTGFGQPSIFNTEALIQEMLRQGKNMLDARDGGASGCVETGAFGKESYILTGYFNLPKVLEIALNNGVDPISGKEIGIRTGDPSGFRDYGQLFDAFRKQLNHFIDIKIAGNRIIERLWARYLPAPFMSILIDDCVSRGMDYNDGGPRYDSSYIQGVGIGTLTDSLAAIKDNIYREELISMEELSEALHKDFKGSEELREILLERSPKYGNDDPSADELIPAIFESFFSAVDGRPNTRGGSYRINLLPTTCHIYFGEKTGATPDGRAGSEPLSEGISPVQGMDRSGPTAVLKSASRIDHLRTGGTLLNQKFTPRIFQSDEGIDRIVDLVRAYFRMDGHHLQFNVVSAKTLRKAQKNPEKYRDLIVRVAGYSDYFVDLGESLQNEIIRRTEHSLDK
ncbi:MAG: formate C-acetyltransferase/glycerol dehydratase family glycyl radical enzyme [Candidatus Latescibacteria bacterium]|nr:formate C-acetyltransferase/glycerol dehydratase family glycyl radical enzyme [bacterium]MBD3423451.1 formate C-acetyltransferase/glycerol dehydratase family glycyl radical enzyme [Candidatus Latescibacterota bacterium]